MAQFAHNNWPSDTTRKSPFFLLMGYNPHADWKHATSPLPQVTLRVDQFKDAQAQAQNLMIKAQKSCVTRPVFSFLFLDYWQVTLIWSPYGDASLIRSLLIGDTSTTYYTDVAIRVTMTLY